MKDIDKNELKNLLLKCWMTHDGMWFYHSMQELGIEKANQINKAAIRSLAGIEMERVRRPLVSKRLKLLMTLSQSFKRPLESLRMTSWGSITVFLQKTFYTRR